MADTESSDTVEESGPRQDAPRRQFSLPPWLDHFNAADLKVLFRCWTAAWVASLLMFIGPALRNIGIATFFGSLLLYIIPPGGILFVYLLASLSLLFGMCLAWAWGLLTMKAALAARPAAQTQALLQALQQEAGTQAQQTGQSPTAIVSKLVYDGFMLDARVTAIFYVLICLFIYAVSRMRAANEKFALTQLFGIIIADMFLLFGPTLPSFKPLLPKVLVIPGAIGIGLGAACSVLIFPQSTSHTVLAKMEQLIQMGEKPLQVTRTRLSEESVDLADLQGAKARAIAAFKAMEPALAFLPLDLSWSRWNQDDVKSLHKPLRRAMIASLSLLDFHIARVRSDNKVRDFKSHVKGDGNGDVIEKPPHTVGQHQIQASADLMQALKSPEEGEMRSQTLEALRHSTEKVLHACSESIQVTAECIHIVNSGRWFGRPSPERVQEVTNKAQSVLETLQSAREKCATETTERLIETHADMFDDNGELKTQDQRAPHALRGIVLGMVIEERILGTAEASEHLLAHIVRLLQARTTDRLWLPSRLQYAFSWVFNGHQAAPISDLSAEGMSDPDMIEEQTKEAHRRLKISRGIGRPVQRSVLSKVIVGTWQWFTSPGGMYALRMVIVTIATAIPAAIPHSAGFYYREKGIWGLITAQTTLLVYMADFTFSMVARAVGTVVGGVLGMVAWYIGSGHGPGNPYGMAAIVGAMTLVLMWWRLFLPPAFTMAAIMSGATFILVVGFSWDDTHAPQYGLPGQGYTAFWKRLVTVLLGFVAALVVQVFPQPPSANRHICKTLSNTVRTLSDHYALLLSHWGRADTNSPVGVVAEKISLEIAETLMSLRSTIPLLRFEVTFGPFDEQTLGQTLALCQDMNQSLGRLLSLSSTLPQELQERLARSVGMLDDYPIGDIMAVLGVVEQALRLGLPLPERLPTPLVKRCYDSWYAQHHVAQLSRDLVRDENYRRYCVAIGSYLKFLESVDELVLVLKGALGEAHIIERWDSDVHS